MSSANQRLVIVLPPMLTVPSWSSKVSVVILSRNTLKRMGESRHPCRTPTLVRNQSPMLRTIDTLMQCTETYSGLYAWLIIYHTHQQSQRQTERQRQTEKQDRQRDIDMKNRQQTSQLDTILSKYQQADKHKKDPPKRTQHSSHEHLLMDSSKTHSQSCTCPTTVATLTMSGQSYSKHNRLKHTDPMTGIWSNSKHDSLKHTTLVTGIWSYSKHDRLKHTASMTEVTSVTDKLKHTLIQPQWLKLQVWQTDWNTQLKWPAIEVTASMTDWNIQPKWMGP